MIRHLCSDFVYHDGVVFHAKYLGRDGWWGDRDYSDFFLNYGIVAVGGGDEIKEGMEVGDYILLHRGAEDICGVGRVLDDFRIEEALIDVEGYGLEKTRRVGWAKNYSGEDLEYYLRPIADASPYNSDEAWIRKDS